MTSKGSPSVEHKEWKAALATFSAGLEAHLVLLETGTPAVDSPWPPANLPTSPMPSDLREEAAALLQAADELSDAMGRQLAGLPVKRGRAPIARPSAPASWSTVL